MKIDDIAGQTVALTHLKNALKKDQISQAYMLIGEPGMGKKTIAESFAESILCEERKPGEYEHCGKCRSCHQVETGNHPDCIFVTHEKSNLISVDEIREQLVSDVEIKPYQGSKKVYIVPDAEMMNEQAQNALLKTLEEPPEYAVIILLVANADLMLPTLLSRSIKLPLAPLPDQVIEEKLIKDYYIQKYRTSSIVKFARGNLGRAIEMSENDDFIEDKKCDLYIATMGEAAVRKALSLTTALRDEGFFVEYDLVERGIKPQMKYADKIGARFVIVLGDNEIESGSAKLKNMATGEQKDITLGEGFIDAFTQEMVNEMFSGLEDELGGIAGKDGV